MTDTADAADRGRVTSVRRERGGRSQPRDPRDPREPSGGPQRAPRVKRERNDQRASSNPGGPTGTAPATSRQVAELITHATLTLAVTVSVLSLLRVITGDSFRPIVLGSVAAGLIVPTVVRACGARWPFGVLAGLAVHAALLTRWVADRRNESSGSSSIANFALSELDDAFSRINQIVTPAPPLVGFGIALAVVGWLIAALSDIFAAGFRAQLEALVPPAAVAAVGATLIARPTATGRVGWMVVVLSTFALHAVVVSIVERHAVPNWFGGRRPSWIGAVGALLVGGLITYGVTAVATPRLRLHERKASLEWRTPKKGPKPQRTVASPLVSLERRLIRQSDIEQFRVRSERNGKPVRTYWRQTSLDQFDGSSWGSTGTYRSVRASRPFGDPGESTDRVSQEFEVGALDSESLPVAYRPYVVEPSDAEFAISYDARSATILAKKPLQPGITYRATSALQTSGFVDVAASSPAVPVAPADDPMLRLPEKFDERIRQLAVEVTSDESTVFGQARALQTFFRTEFRYSLDVDDTDNTTGTASDDPLVRFVLEDRVGFCQQFSGAFATMARSLGIPARVAVGFTGGRLGSDGWFSVTGKNAHAWPEIRLPDGTWVPFEPTPGRGIPGFSDTTGLPFEDESEGIAPGADEATVNDLAPTTTTSAPSTTAAPRAAATNPEVPTPTKKKRELRPFLLGGLVVIGAALVFVTVRKRRRGGTREGTAPRRIARGVPTPAEQIDALWNDLERRLASAPTPRRRSETETERRFAERLADELPMLPPLADHVQRARYDRDETVNAADHEQASALRAAAIAVLERTPS